MVEEVANDYSDVKLSHQLVDSMAMLLLRDPKRYDVIVGVDGKDVKDGPAGLVKAKAGGLVSAGERIVVLNTGNGLKDVAGAMKSVKMAGTTAHRVAPDIDDLRRIMKEL